MNRTKQLAAAAAVAASLALAAPALAGQTASPPLAGSVGPSFTISLTKDGKAVKTLKPGSYTITVKDKASQHNFHLSGPGVDKVVTTVPFVGTKKITVTLKKGTYKFVCDPHASSMKGSFKVA